MRPMTVMGKYLGVVIVSFYLAGCSNSPTTPTPQPITPVVTTPPVVTAPPVTTPAPSTPTPTITSYAGRWIGEYVVQQCAGASGSMDDVLCSAPRPGSAGGVFQRDTRFPITLELTQSGSTVAGTLTLGLIRGTVSGSVTSANRLILSGTLFYSDAASGVTLTNTLTDWDTSLGSDLLSGTFALNVRFNTLPGDGVVRVLLQNTMRR